MESKVSDAQRRLEVQNRLADPHYNREQRRRAEQLKAQLQATEEASTRDLITEMDFANEQDQNALSHSVHKEESKISDTSEGKAMHRFFLLPKVRDLMKKKGI